MDFLCGGIDYKSIVRQSEVITCKSGRKLICCGLSGLAVIFTDEGLDTKKGRYGPEYP